LYCLSFFLFFLLSFTFFSLISKKKNFFFKNLASEDEGDVSDDAIDDKYPKTPYLDDKIETPTTETTIEECAAQLKESNNIYVQVTTMKMKETK